MSLSLSLVWLWDPTPQLTKRTCSFCSVWGGVAVSVPVSWRCARLHGAALSPSQSRPAGTHVILRHHAVGKYTCTDSQCTLPRRERHWQELVNYSDGSCIKCALCVLEQQAKAGKPSRSIFFRALLVPIGLRQSQRSKSVGRHVSKGSVHGFTTTSLLNTLVAVKTCK